MNSLPIDLMRAIICILPEKEWHKTSQVSHAFYQASFQVLRNTTAVKVVELIAVIRGCDFFSEYPTLTLELSEAQIINSQCIQDLGSQIQKLFHELIILKVDHFFPIHLAATKKHNDVFYSFGIVIEKNLKELQRSVIMKQIENIGQNSDPITLSEKLMKGYSWLIVHDFIKDAVRIAANIPDNRCKEKIIADFCQFLWRDGLREEAIKGAETIAGSHEAYQDAIVAMVPRHIRLRCFDEAICCMGFLDDAETRIFYSYEIIKKLGQLDRVLSLLQRVFPSIRDGCSLTIIEGYLAIPDGKNAEAILEQMAPGSFKERAKALIEEKRGSGLNFEV